MIGKRFAFTGTVGGKAYAIGGFKDVELLKLCNVRLCGKLFQPKAYFTLSPPIERLELREGDEVKFTATVEAKDTVDWLVRPRNWQLVRRA